MDVILLERIGKLGAIGDVVSVKPGFARNYLIPTGRALRANEANRERFEREKEAIVARNNERKSEAEKVSGDLDGRSFIVVRSAGETGQLYGSVAARDVVEVLTGDGFKVSRNQVNLNQPIKAIGLHEVGIQLHSEVEATVTFNVARSEDEAERQAAGEDLTSAEAIYGEADEDDQIQPDAFFDDEVLADENVKLEPLSEEIDATERVVDPSEQEQPYV